MNRSACAQTVFLKGDVPVCSCEIDDQAERGCEDGCVNRSVRHAGLDGARDVGLTDSC
jgi:hypothetical protein